MKKLLVCGVTGPSLYSPQIQQMIEKEFHAIPIFLNQSDPDDLIWILDKCDFVVLAGGSDWCPTSTGGEIVNGENLSKFDIPRDLREIKIMDWAKETQKNILGICRGHQGIGLYHGLNLNLDISGSEIVHNPSSANIKMDDYPVHFVHCFDQFKQEYFDRHLTNSFHHQALSYLQSKGGEYYSSRDIEPLGYSYTYLPNDKFKQGLRIIELMKTSDNLWLSSQWHPELDYEKNPASRTVINKFKEMLINNGLDLTLPEQDEIQEAIKSKK